MLHITFNVNHFCVCTSGRGRCRRRCLSNTWSCSADILMITIQVQLPLYLNKCTRNQERSLVMPHVLIKALNREGENQSTAGFD